MLVTREYLTPATGSSINRDRANADIVAHYRRNTLHERRHDYSHQPGIL
jgi:hypothetical protein